MKKWLYRLILVLCIGVFCYSGWNLWSIQHEYQQGDDTYTEAVDDFITPVERPDQPVISDAPEEEPVDDPDSSSQTPPFVYVEPDQPPISVNFAKLQKVNPDVVGWIVLEGTQLSYPLLQSHDNEDYLHTLYNGKHNSAGSIFLDSSCTLDDANIIIYGHHMKNGSMFATLMRYEKQSFYDRHPILWILTPEQTWKVRLFSGYITESDSAAYTIYHSAGESFASYLKKAQSKSAFRNQVSLEGAEQCVVLSTCAYDFEDARFVVHGILEPVD